MKIVYLDGKLNEVNGPTQGFGKVILCEMEDGSETLLVFPEGVIHVDALDTFERKGYLVRTARGANYFMERVNGSSSSIKSLPKDEWLRVQTALFPEGGR